MKRSAPLVALLYAALVLAGCSSSGGEADSTTTAAPAEETTTTVAETATTAAGSETTTTEAGSTDATLPTYDEAKQVYLEQADEASKSSCADDSEDKDVYVSSGTYTRFVCSGITRFEYIEGAENYEENWPSISSAEEYRAVFHVPGALVVVPVGSNEDFAPALAADCSCGEVVEQQG